MYVNLIHLFILYLELNEKEKERERTKLKKKKKKKRKVLSKIQISGEKIKWNGTIELCYQK